MLFKGWLSGLNLRLHLPTVALQIPAEITIQTGGVLDTLVTVQPVGMVSVRAHCLISFAVTCEVLVSFYYWRGTILQEDSGHLEACTLQVHDMLPQEWGSGTASVLMWSCALDSSVLVRERQCFSSLRSGQKKTRSMKGLENTAANSGT